VSANCPRCAKPLEDQQLDDLSFRCCRGCKGMLILHAALIDILDRSWHAVSRETAETTSFRTPEGWQNTPAMCCPDCQQGMEKYGYMGIGAIQINRCDACTLLWLDADELQNMVLALAKTNYRTEAAWQESRRRDVDIVAPAVEMSRLHSSRWRLSSTDGSNATPAFALLSLLLD
jgi:Zn-finger nucleic acid-binding protein